jgi:hypothetical protein
MKKIIYFMTLGIVVSLLFVSCLDEDNIQAPTVSEVKMYMVAKDGSDSLITQPIKGKAMKFVVITKADICSVWPGGSREIVKKKKSLDGGVTFPDSIDMFNHPVLKASDLYTDYGLVGAKGLKTTQLEGGWYCTYTYKNSGTYDLSIVVTNHGYDGPEYQQVVVDGGKITVK